VQDQPSIEVRKDIGVKATTVDYKVAIAKFRSANPGTEFDQHPQYGPNPTMAVCYWCSKPTGETVLLGNSYMGKAPSQMVTDYSFCPQCQVDSGGGIWCVEIVPSSESNLPEIAPGMAPTGRKVPVSRASVQQFPLAPQYLKKVLIEGYMVCPVVIFQAVSQGAG
jgi:hypothetical protein